jgi:hypothetical protein
MAASVEDDVLVDFVADQDDVRPVDDGCELPHVVGRPRRPGRIVRRVDEDRARTWRDGAPHLIPVHRVVRIPQAHEHRRAAAQADDGHVRVVARLEQHDLVAGLHERGERGKQACRRSGGDHDFGQGVVLRSVELLHFRRNAFAQRHDPGHRRVLVVPVAHRPGHGLDERRVAIEIGETLRQVDRLVLVGELRLDRKNADADVGQFRGDGHGRGHDVPTF